MSNGPKCGSQRAKPSKHMAGSTKKKFRSSDPDGMKRYQEKLAKRAARKLKKKSKKR